MERFITNFINAVLFMITVTVSGLISGLYVSSSSEDLSKNVLLVKTIEESYAVEKVEENFYRENIPEEFFDVFWYYTKERPELRSSIYAIMKQETSVGQSTGEGIMTDRATIPSCRSTRTT